MPERPGTSGAQTPDAAAIAPGPPCRNTAPGAARGRGHRAARVLAVAAMVVCGLAACSSREPQTEASRSARAQTLIEAGNTAYRQGDYRLAVRRYAAAAVVRKNDPAAYYGMGMALSKLGRDEEARAAYARARELAHAPAAGAGTAGRARPGSP